MKLWQKTAFLRQESISNKGWLFDIMRCVDALQTDTFSLKDMYQFEALLQKKHPDNHFIKAKIRQQLQILRDRGVIHFIKRGVYRKMLL